MMSLRTRVVLSAAAVLGLCVLLIGIGLERAVRDTVQSAREARLLAQLYLLMAEAESDGERLVFPNEHAESRLKLPGSGLYARVFDASGDQVWQSPSAMGVMAPEPARLSPGERRFDLGAGPDGNTYLSARFGVSWATGPIPRQYTFGVAEDTGEMELEVARFRASLMGWLAGMSLLMLGALVLVLRWGLMPLGRVAAQVSAVERGDQTLIQGTYPMEIAGLTDNLNALLAHERARHRRLDDALGDLAHSLKTPLAVMRGAIDEDLGLPQTRALLDEQLGRMVHIVEHQLNRARTGNPGAPALMAPVSVRRALERLAAALAKVYRDKSVQVEIQVDPGLVFRGVEADLFEMLGNLLENAFKWCEHRVRISGGTEGTILELLVDDDGPGIVPQQAHLLLARGARADESMPGHGIGLAVVRDICDAYGGTFGLEDGPLGGVRCRLRLPG